VTIAMGVTAVGHRMDITDSSGERTREGVTIGSDGAGLETTEERQLPERASSGATPGHTLTIRQDRRRLVFSSWWG
jgi:hypothetical protein